MSGRQRALDEDSQGTQSDCEESECDEVLVRKSSIELDEELSSGDEESDLGKDDGQPGKNKMKVKYKGKRAGWMNIVTWDRF